MYRNVEWSVFILRIFLVLTGLFICACSTTNRQWVNYDRERNTQYVLDKDSFECSNYADYKTAGVAEASARATGGAAGMGGPGAGVAQLFSGLITTDYTRDSHYQACMRSRGWRSEER